MDLKPGNKWEYSYWLRTFKTNYDLTRQVVTHDSDVKVKCEVCGIISKNRVTLSSHMWNVHSNRKRPSCDTCHQVFSTPANLRRHIGTVHSTGNDLVSHVRFSDVKKPTKRGVVCGNTHVNAEHSENPIRYGCTLCGNEFKRKHELEGHILTHTTEKPFNCATCGRSFAHMRSVKRHETFLWRHDLQRHIRVAHENRRNYPCTFCDQRFPNSSDLKRHVEAKHATSKDLIHSCYKCEYKSHSKANLASHKMRHNAARHGCYFCGKKFFTFKELADHCRVHILEKLTYL